MQRLGRCHALLGTTLFACLMLSAQEPMLRFKNYGTREGLSHVSVYAAVQDRLGFLWVATEDGLNRFDGYRFKSYRHQVGDPTSLSDNYLQCLVIDRQDQLWIGTNSGLELFNPVHERFSRLTAPNKEPLGRIRSLCLDEQGQVWVGNQKGLFRFNSQTHQATFMGRPADLRGDFGPVLSICADAQGEIWVGTADGLFVYDPQTQILQQDRTGIAYLDEDVQDLYPARDGGLWIGTISGIFKRTVDGQYQVINLQTKELKATGPVMVLFEDSQGLLWISKGGEFYNYGPNGLNLVPVDPSRPGSIVGQNIFSILEDREGLLWFGTESGGLNVYDRSHNVFRNTTKGPQFPGLVEVDVTALLRDVQDRLWVGSTNGLYRQLPQENTFTAYFNDPLDASSLVANRVSSICTSQSGAIWIGSIGGLARYNEATNDFQNFRADLNTLGALSSDFVWSLYEDRAGQLWVGTSRAGLDLYQADTGTFRNYNRRLEDPFSLSDHFIRCMLEDKQGRFWIGTGTAGLNLMDRATGRFTHYRHNEREPSSLSQDSVRALFQDQKGRLWVGTQGGLNLMNPESGTFKSWGEQNGLANESVQGILDDASGQIWVSTLRGLSCFDPETEKFRSYDQDNGLPHDVFNPSAAFRDSDLLMFGGINGFTTFNPALLNRKPFQPTLAFTDFLILNQPVPLQRYQPDSPLTQSITLIPAVRLEHTHSMFTVHFSALDYTAPLQTNYAYTLNGYDPRWIETKSENRAATYTNLPAGSYTLRVKAQNKEGLWSDNVAKLRIEITAPPWMRWWAKFLYALLIFGMVWAYIRQLRLRLAHQRQIAYQQQQMAEQERRGALDLMEMVEARTRELAERNMELETLDRIVREINRETGIAEMLETILKEALRLVPHAEKGTFLLRQRVSNRVIVVATFGYDDIPSKNLDLTLETLQARYRFGLEGPEPGIFRLEPHPDLPGAQAMGILGICASVVAMELHLEGRHEGYLLLDNMTHRNIFTEMDVRKLSRFREHAVTTLAKARAMQDLLDAQRELMTAAHEAGMAEIASEVLHNVGNLLNTVKTSGFLLCEAVSREHVLVLLEKVGALLDVEPLTPSVVASLKSCVQRCKTLLRTQHDHVLCESQRLGDGLDAIQALLGEQHNLALNVPRHRERVDLHRLIEETLHTALPQELRQRVTLDLGPVAFVVVEVFKLRRLVMFLLDNARESIQGHSTQGSIQISSRKEPGFYVLTVTDDGQGFGDVEVCEIFGQHLNRTRKSRWYGLHYCANTIREMQGCINACREGNLNHLSLWIPAEHEPPEL